MFLLGGLVLVVPFVLPIVALVRASRVRELALRVEALELRLVSVERENAALRARPVETVLPAPRFEASSPRPTPIEARVDAASAPSVDPDAAHTETEHPALMALQDLADASRAAAAPGGTAGLDAPAGVAPPPAASPPREPPKPVPSKPAIEWEQWLGVRGAAALGGIVLALAGILFFQYSIQHGLISPSLRVVLGTLLGLGCIIGSTRLRRYESSANALAGGGAVVLYASFWAARVLYELVPLEAAFALMALVTAVTALLAVRYASPFVATLGLAGGFLTPLLLASGSNRPIGLFAYLLLLDAGFLLVAYRKRWAGLALFALVGSLAIEALWVGYSMESGQLAIGLGATGLFAVLFLLAGSRADASQPATRMWRIMQAAAILLPHGFALAFALDAKLGAHLYPVAILLALLEVAALWLASQARAETLPRLLPIGAGAGTLAVVACWLGRASMSSATSWEATVVVLGLATPAAIASVRKVKGVLVAGMLYPGGLLVVLSLWTLGCEAIVPWATLLGVVGLVALLLVQSSRLALLAAVAPAALGTALALLDARFGDARSFLSPSRFVLVEVVVLVALHAVAVARRGELRRRAAEGVVLCGAFILLGLDASDHYFAQPTAFVYGVPLLVAALLVLSVVLRGDGRWLVGAAVPLLLVHVVAAERTLVSPLRASPVALVCSALSVALFAWSPFLAWPRLRRHTSFYVSALAGLGWLFPSLRLWRDAYSAVGQGGVAIVYAAITLTTVPTLRRRLAGDRVFETSALAWVGAAALGLVAIAIPLELERQWITIGYALQAAAVVLLWRRLDHPGLKYFALALAGAVTVRLCINPEVLLYASRGSLRILNWLLYTYWVPALALLVAARVLGQLEVARLRSWEYRFYERPGDRPLALGQTFLVLCVILVVFVWLNLAIFDWFGSGEALRVTFERRPARDLTTSMAWVLYAVVLLALGVWRRSSGLRWVSLTMMVVTIGKVFLYDLGQLRDLYRVVSLLGLALSLIVVSLAYQRFVFRPAPRSP